MRTRLTDLSSALVGVLAAAVTLVPTAALPASATDRGLAATAGPSAPSNEPADEAVWPLEPEPDVVRGFEPPPGPYAAGHRGVDLAGVPGQAVRSALPGTIGFAGSIGGKPVVTVLHDGQRTTYEPVTTTLSPGDRVAAGDVIGSLVVVDSHCFPAACLHWGLVRGFGDEKEYLDPLSLLGGGPVRLLPLWREEPATLRLPWVPLSETWRRPLDWRV